MLRHALFWILLAATALPAQAEEPNAARGVVTRLEAALVAVSKEPKAQGNPHAGMQQLLATVEATHDTLRMAERRLGPLWAGLNPAEQERVTSLLLRRVAAGYAREAAAGPLRFAPRPAEPGARESAPPAGTGKEVLVRSQRTGSAGTKVTMITYVLHTAPEPGGEPRIVNRLLAAADATAAVVDEAQRDRTEVAHEVKAGGLARLLARWEADLPPPNGAKPKPPATALATVRLLQETLLELMKQGRSMRYAQRYARLEPVIRRTHYLPVIARLTIRRQWGSLTKAQQQGFVKIFSRLSVANYASRFSSWSGEQFKQLEERKAGKSTLVRSTLTKSNGEVIRFDYTMRRIEKRWRILNITVDGVSDLSTKQAEYATLLSAGGLPRLLQRLREQIRKLETG